MNREDLKKYKYNQRWIRDRMTYLQEYKTYITNITSNLSDMPNGSKRVQDSMAEKVATLVDSIDDLMNKVVEEDEKQKQILEQLNKVEQPYKLILELHYVQGKTLVDIASEMNYNYNRIKHMNGEAILKFENIIKK